MRRLLFAAFLFAACCPEAFAQGTLFFESGVDPFVDEGSGLTVSDLFYPGHRFEVTTPIHVTAAGGFFQDLNPGDFSEVFVALVALSGPTDLPDDRYLLSADVLATSLMTVEDAQGDYLAPFAVDLPAGWYMVVMGFGAFGADQQTGPRGLATGFTDNDPDQKAVSIRTDYDGPIEQDAVARFLVAVPESSPGAAGATALASLAALGGTRRRANRSRAGRG